VTGDAVYLDFAATTPMDPRVADAMLECAGADGTFANPSSVHIAGRRAAAVVEEARAALASLMRTEPGRLTWTSGATESDNLAIRGAALARAHRGKHLISMPTEHKAVSETFRALEKEGFELTWLAPDSGGLLSLEALSRALRDDTQLVSVMHVNNETGVIQDICAIGELCREHDVLFHTDAAQSVGKLDIDLGAMPVDLVSLTGHKFYAPKGIGALYIAARPGLRIFPILYGGGQEKRLRPGTLPVHQIAGLGKAAAIAARERQANYRHVSAMRDRLWHGIADLPGLQRNGDIESGYPGILNVTAAGMDGESLLLALEPVCVGSGSACNSAVAEPSSVLRALGRTDAEAQSAVRFSFGRTTTAAEVDFAIDRYRSAVTRLRAIAPVT